MIVTLINLFYIFQRYLDNIYVTLRKRKQIFTPTIRPSLKSSIFILASFVATIVYMYTQSLCSLNLKGDVIICDNLYFRNVGILEIIQKNVFIFQARKLRSRIGSDKIKIILLIPSTVLFSH